MKAMNLNGKIINLNKYDINFYRGNNIEQKLIILSAILKGKNLIKSRSRRRLDLLRKKESQPTQVKTW